MADTYFIYGLAIRNGRVAVQLNGERYPANQQLNHQTLARVHQNLTEHGSFSTTIEGTEWLRTVCDFARTSCHLIAEGACLTIWTEYFPAGGLGVVACQIPSFISCGYFFLLKNPLYDTPVSSEIDLGARISIAAVAIYKTSDISEQPMQFLTPSVMLLHYIFYLLLFCVCVCVCVCMCK